jgi:GDP-L-fucose synthase
LTIRELAAMVREAVGFKGDIAFDASKPDGTPRKLLDVSRMASLGWRSRTSLEAGLQRAYADFLERYPPSQPLQAARG